MLQTFILTPLYLMSSLLVFCTAVDIISADLSNISNVKGIYNCIKMKINIVLALVAAFVYVILMSIIVVLINLF
jgi:hypothetical protein